MTASKYQRTPHAIARHKACIEACRSGLWAGMTREQITEMMVVSFTSSEVKTALNYAVETGLIFTNGRRSHLCLYFDTREAVEAWSAWFSIEQAERRRQRDRSRPRAAFTRQVVMPPKACMPASPKPRPLSSALQRFKTSEAANPNNVKPQIVPCGMDTRFRVTGPIRGGLKDLGIGRYPEAARWSAYAGA